MLFFPFKIENTVVSQFLPHVFMMILGGARSFFISIFTQPVLCGPTESVDRTNAFKAFKKTQTPGTKEY